MGSKKVIHVQSTNTHDNFSLAIIERMLAREDVAAELKKGTMTISVGGIQLSQASYPRVSKIFLDDGNEDPISVQFAERMPFLGFQLENFGVGTMHADARQAAARLSRFLVGILNKQYKLTRRSLAGCEIYTMYVETDTFESVRRTWVGAALIPNIMVKIFGNLTILFGANNSKIKTGR
jgi:hypothetical protein